MHLLDIPPELLDQIILALALTVPRTQLLGLRGVCRKFFSNFFFFTLPGDMIVHDIYSRFMWVLCIKIVYVCVCVCVICNLCC